MGLEIEERTEGSWRVLVVQGEVDMASAPDLRDALEALIDGGRTRLVVDLSSVDFMDSSGVGVLVGAHRRLEESGGGLALVCGEGPVRRVLGITGLDEVFAVHGTLEEVTG